MSVAWLLFDIIVILLNQVLIPPVQWVPGASTGPGRFSV